MRLEIKYNSLLQKLITPNVDVKSVMKADKDKILERMKEFDRLKKEEQDNACLHSVSHRLTQLNSKLELIEEILSINGAVTRRRLERIKDSIINELQVEIKNSCG